MNEKSWHICWFFNKICQIASTNTKPRSHPVGLQIFRFLIRHRRFLRKRDMNSGNSAGRTTTCAAIRRKGEWEKEGREDISFLFSFLYWLIVKC